MEAYIHRTEAERENQLTQIVLQPLHTCRIFLPYHSNKSLENQGPGVTEQAIPHNSALSYCY